MGDLKRGGQQKPASPVAGFNINKCLTLRLGFHDSERVNLVLRHETI